MRGATCRPPGVARLLARVLAPPSLREQIDGDLAEGFLLRCRRDGTATARRWYWRQLLSLDVLRLRRERNRHRHDNMRRNAMGIGNLWRDVRFAARELTKNPTYTAVVVATLALGIGVNTAVFTVVHAVLLRPLPYADSERLAMVFRTVPRLGFTRSVVSYPDFLDWRAQAESFADMAGYASHRATFVGAEGAEEWAGYRVTAGLFPLLGVAPIRGRLFTEAEDTPGAEPVILLGYGEWQSRFAGDPGVVGEVLRLGGEGFLVVGVMPRDFAFPAPGVPYWIPLRGDAKRMERDTNFLTVIGRLASGVPVTRAQIEMEGLVARIDATAPGGNAGYGVFVEARHGFVVRNARTALTVFSTAVAMILAIACANVANLMLVRGASRRRELAVRAALGARSRRLVALLLSESTLLAAFGGAFGLLLSLGLVRILLALEPNRLPRATEVGVDITVLWFTAAVSLGCGIAFGTIPSLLAARADLLQPLKSTTAAGGSGRRSRRLRGGFVVVQVALAMVLLVAGGLLISSFVRLTAVEPGFDPRDVVAGRVAPPFPPEPTDLPREQMQQFFDNAVTEHTRFFEVLLDRMRGLPRVESAGLAYGLPFDRGHRYSRNVTPEGMEITSGEGPVVPGNVIGGDYLAAMGITVVQGRGFSAADGPSSPLVALVNETMARAFWPRQQAVGKRLRIGDGEGPWTTVVGVVADARRTALDEAPEPLFYRPLSQARWPEGMFLVVRAAAPPQELIGALREQVWKLDPNLPVTDAASASELVRASVAEPRFRTVVLTTFGALASLLALLGLYGVIAHSVSDRTHEMSVRMALGADYRQILAMVLRSGLGLALVGIALGTAAALGITRFLGGMLFAVTPADPLTFVVVAATLAGAATLACLVPARRAMRTDLRRSLRCE